MAWEDVGVHGVGAGDRHCNGGGGPGREGPAPPRVQRLLLRSLLRGLFL